VKNGEGLDLITAHLERDLQGDGMEVKGREPALVGEGEGKDLGGEEMFADHTKGGGSSIYFKRPDAGRFGIVAKKGESHDMV
jgi:hypothetical protein